MYKFFQRNQKKLLAVFGVVLMVTFLMPTFRTASQMNNEHVAGTIGTENVTLDNFDDAKAEWEFLMRRVMVRTGQTGENQWTTVMNGRMETRILASQLHENPNAYYLLMYEAKHMGYAPHYQQAEEFLRNPGGNVAIAMANDTKIPWESLTDELLKDSAKQAVADLMMVIDCFDRALTVVKVSDPLVRHELASAQQRIKSRVVDFTVSDNLRNVPAPTPDDLQRHFQAYGSVEAGADKGEKNPFGFGYKYPNRVKVQYIGIPRAEIRKAIQAQKSEYDWEVEGHRYYDRHLAEFPTTQPTTSPITMIGPTTQSGPTTQPYEFVKSTIMDRLIEPQVNKLQQQIQSQITSRLNLDYQSYLKIAGSTTAPTGANYESFEYLQKLAADIEKQHKVTLTVASVADAFRDHSQLSELPGIGKIVKFPDYALTVVEPFASVAMGTIPASLKLFEPSKPLIDEQGVADAYIFRVIAGDPSHQPASVDEVKDRVEQDWKKMQAWELAKTDAKKLLEAAREPGLEAASSDRKVMTTSFYSSDPRIPIENYTISTTAQREFVKDTFGLLSVLAQKDHPRPIALIEMPIDGKIAVAELIAVDSNLSPEMVDFAKNYMSSQFAEPYQMSVLQSWFDYDSIVERLGYKDESHGRSVQ